MKNITKKITAVLLCGAVLTSLAGCQSEEEKKKNLTVANVENPTEDFGDYFDISYKEWYGEYMIRMTAGGYTETNDAEIAKSYREDTIKYLAQERIVIHLAKDMGISSDTLTQEELDQAEKSANEDIESWLKRYEARALSTMPEGYSDEDLRKKEEELFKELLDELDMTRDIFYTWAVNDIIHDKFVAKASESITDEYIKDFVQDTIDEAKDKYENDLAAFEEKYTAFYVPEGTRKVQQIAILINNLSASEIAAYRKDGDDAKADEILKEQLEKIKFRADEAYEKLQSGQAWEDVQEEYNDETSSNKVDFTVYPKSSTVLQKITDAAMGIDHKGGISEIFETDKGYFILYYKDDITMTDERMDNLIEQADEFLRNEKAYEPIAKFLEEHPYTYDYDTLRIDEPEATASQTVSEAVS